MERISPTETSSSSSGNIISRKLNANKNKIQQLIFKRRFNSLATSFKLLGILLCLSLVAGCVNAPYKYGTGRMDIDLPKSPIMEQQYFQGEPHQFLDASDWIWPGSWLSKLLLWDASIDSHQISPQTIAALKLYIEENGLENLQVLINCYKPGNQWSRLFKNRTIHPFWRYTFGVLSVAGYTILPGRFFGGDSFNPYTNTINLYSDSIPIAIHEAGHAKDFGSREMKGTNAFIYSLPLAALYYEAVASSDALTYFDEKQQAAELKDAYEILYPAYGTYLGGNLARNSSNVALQYVLVIPAHIAGRIASWNVDDDFESSQFDSNTGVEAKPENSEVEGKPSN